jgi:hypothetical protein
MKSARTWLAFLWVLSVAIANPTLCRASSGYLEVQLDRGSGILKAPQPDYSATRVGVAIGRDLKPWLKRKLGWNPDGEWSVRLEPYAALIDSPDSNFELGCAAGLRIAMPLGDVAPYVHASTGPFYTSQRTLEQSTHFNFASYGGIGVEVKLDDESGLTLERYVRHFSNASLKDPNDGVDTRGWLLGYVTYL